MNILSFVNIEIVYEDTLKRYSITILSGMGICQGEKYCMQYFLGVRGQRPETRAHAARA